MDAFVPYIEGLYSKFLSVEKIIFDVLKVVEVTDPKDPNKIPISYKVIITLESKKNLGEVSILYDIIRNSKNIAEKLDHTFHTSSATGFNPIEYARILTGINKIVGEISPQIQTHFLRINNLETP